MVKELFSNLGHIQKTLVLPLWGRAVESKKENPMLVDNKAVEIMAQFGVSTEGFGENLTEISRLGWIKRCIYIDQVVRDFNARYPQALIVNLGSGLDTTFERCDNEQLHWIDLDLPDAIALRKRFFSESHRHRFIEASFMDMDWLEELHPVQNVLFIAAGLFYYFEEKEIRAFFNRLAYRFPGCEVVFDASSPFGVKMANRVVIKTSGLDERSFLKWGLKDPNELLAWGGNIRLLQTIYYYSDTDQRISFGTRLMGKISDWLRIQYIVHISLGED